MIYSLWLDEKIEPPKSEPWDNWWWATNLNNAKEIIIQKHGLITTIDVDIMFSNLTNLNDFFYWMRNNYKAFDPIVKSHTNEVQS